MVWPVRDGTLLIDEARLDDIFDEKSGGGAEAEWEISSALEDSEREVERLRPGS